jgi:hypothetical protein
MGLGAAWGWLAASLAMIAATDGELVSALAIALVFGGTLGALTGMLVGLPVAIVVGHLRPRLTHWRATGTFLALGMAAVVAGLSAVDAGWEVSWSALWTVGPWLTVVGVSAWIGLGWIFAARQDVIPSEAHAPRSP